MKKQTNPSVKAHLLRSAFILLSLLAVCVIPFALGERAQRFQHKDISTRTTDVQPPTQPSTLCQAIANGGFETGSLPPWTDTGDTSFTGVSTTNPHSGTYSLYAGPDTSDGFIDQVLPTVAGTAYDVSFWLKNDDTTGNNRFGASFGGVTLVAEASQGQFGYTLFTFHNVIPGANADLHFIFYNPPSYFYLDDVCVTPSGGSMPTAKYDFNGDGHPDFMLYNASTRRTAIWYLNDNAYIGGVYGPTLPAGWALIDAADFNGDGHPDYLLYNATTHQTAIWYLNNNVLISGVYGPTVPNGWQPVGAADFNGDGHPDYVLFNSTTQRSAIWYLNNNAYVSGVYGPTLPGGWSLVGLADFNGDGNTDYVLFNSTTRQSAIWYLNNNAYVSGVYGPTLPSGWQLVATADFNSDGHPDYVLFNSTTQQSAIWHLNNNAYVSGAYAPTLPAGWTPFTVNQSGGNSVWNGTWTGTWSGTFTAGSCSWTGTTSFTMTISTSGNSVSGTADHNGLPCFTQTCGINDFENAMGTVSGSVSGQTIQIQCNVCSTGGVCSGECVTESFTGTLSGNTITAMVNGGQITLTKQ